MEVYIWNVNIWNKEKGWFKVKGCVLLYIKFEVSRYLRFCFKEREKKVKVYLKKISIVVFMFRYK